MILSVANLDDKLKRIGHDDKLKRIGHLERNADGLEDFMQNSFGLFTTAKR